MEQIKYTTALPLQFALPEVEEKRQRAEA
jgi:hypothetical protein